jgi:hypothetical protein
MSFPYAMFFFVLRNVSSEESLVVERESKANVLARFGTPLM